MKKDQIKIVYRNIDDLKSAEYNPRKIGSKQKMELTVSLKKLGFSLPIAINVNPKRKDVIIGGHQRVMVAKDLGHKEMPCVEVNLPLDKEKELNLRLNKNGGEFDSDLLALLDKDLLRQVGFLDKEINKAFADSNTIAQEEEFTTEVLEENNYIVFTFDNSIDWLTISDKLDLKSVNALDSKHDYRRKGIGRVIDGKKLLELLQ